MLLIGICINFLTRIFTNFPDKDLHHINIKASCITVSDKILHPVNDKDLHESPVKNMHRIPDITRICIGFASCSRRGFESHWPFFRKYANWKLSCFSSYLLCLRLVFLPPPPPVHLKAPQNTEKTLAGFYQFFASQPPPHRYIWAAGDEGLYLAHILIC